MKRSSTQESILAAQQGRENIPVLRAVRSDPDSAAVITKLVDSKQTPSYDRKGNRTVETPSIHALREVANRTAQRGQDTDHIFAMLPDLELVRQVLISSILAPKDLVTTDLGYDCADDIFTADLRSTLIAKTKDYFESSYKIKEYLYDILDRVLFTDGSYPVAVIPENAIDELINSNSNFSMESLSGEFINDSFMRGLGLLGPAGDAMGSDVVSLEALGNLQQRAYVREDESVIHYSFESAGSVQTYTSNISVTDNYNCLKRPLIENNLRKRRVHNALGTSLESQRKKVEIDSISDRELHRLLYKGRNQSSDAVRVVKTQDQIERRSVTEPLIQRFPSEAVIPVYVPGSTDHHVGYFVMLDMNGNPVTKDSLKIFSGGLLANSQSRPFVSSLIERTRQGMLGDLDCYNRQHQDLMVKTYADIVEADLLARLRNGIYSSSARLASNQEVYRIMLTRELANNRTQVLWIPAEIMTYFAFDFDSNGIGRSLVDRNSVTAALRSVLLFADIRAGIRNSVGRTVVDVVLDEEDIDPQKRAEEIVGEFMRTRQSAVPYSISSPTDTAEFISRAGYEFKFSGHPRLPNMTIDQTESGRSFVTTNDELSESLRKQHHMGFGLTSEILDNMNQPEHAVTAVNQSILLTKRVIQHQEKFNPLITDHIRKVINASEKLITEYNDLIHREFDKVVLTEELRRRAEKEEDVKEAIIGIIVRDFIDSLEVTLSRPLTTNIANQLDELDEYERMLDKKIQTYLSSEVFDESMAGELSGKTDVIAAIIKSHFMREKMAEMGLGEEVSKFFVATKDDISLNQVLSAHGELVSNVLVSFTEHMANMTKLREASTRAAEALDVNGTGGGGDYGSDDGSSDEGDEDFGGFGDDAGGDEFGGDDFGDDGEDTDSEGGDDEVGTEGEEDLGESTPMSF